MTTQNTSLSEKITIRQDYDRFANNVTLGDLTKKQYAALREVARLSPGYNFEVVQYAGGPSSTATHVKIFSDTNNRSEVALVGRGCAQYYDAKPETEKVVRRICARVYRQTVSF